MHAINSGARLVSLLRHFPFPRRALDLGCGSDSDLATCLISLGSERQLAHFVTVHIVSLDLQFPALRSIQRKANIHELVLISSVQANLDHLPFSRHVAFDLILIRHPDIDRMRTSWKRALEVAPGLLGSTGIVLITTYSTAEMEEIQHWLIASALIEYPLALDQLVPPDLSGRDRFVAGYRVGHCLNY